MLKAMGWQYDLQSVLINLNMAKNTLCVKSKFLEIFPK